MKKPRKKPLDWMGEYGLIVEGNQVVAIQSPEDEAQLQEWGIAT